VIRVLEKEKKRACICCLPYWLPSSK